MKRIILGAIILLLVNFAAMAQTVRNETNCPVNVTRECYDICVLVSTNTITVQSGQTLSFALTPCPQSFERCYLHGVLEARRALSGTAACTLGKAITTSHNLVIKR